MDLNIDISNFDTSNVTDTSGMFYFSSLVKFKMPKKINTSKVTNMSHMFSIFGNKNEANDWSFLDDVDTSNVTDMSGLFKGTNIEGLDLSRWDVSKVEDFSLAFNNTTIKKLDLSSWNLSTVKYAKNMLWCSNIEEINLGSFNFYNVPDYQFMFGVNQANIANAYKVLDISGSDWNEDAQNKDKMFYNIFGATIYVKDEKAKAFIEPLAPGNTVLIKSELNN